MSFYSSVLRRRLLQKAAAGGADFETVGASFSTSGGMEDTTVTVDGKTYRLMKITKSGDLTLADPCAVSICLVGGGGNGGPGGSNGGGGGGGGYMLHVLNVDAVQSLTFSIGAATQATTVSGDASGTANGGDNGSNMATGGDGGSGGGCGGEYNANMKAGTGDGKSKYPFGITSLLAHCAGGGGGNYYYVQIFEYDENGIVADFSERGRKGGDGGTNGGDGIKASSASIGTSAQTTKGGLGGTYGGGVGGQAHSIARYSAGSDGTFYGAGGGGGGMYYTEDPYYGDSAARGAGGSGYQGVAYVISAAYPATV